MEGSYTNNAKFYVFKVFNLSCTQVAGVVGRADVMAALFCASAMLLYRPSRSGLLVTMATCLASALSKEIGVASFILCPLYEYLIRRRVSSTIVFSGVRLSGNVVMYR